MGNVAGSISAMTLRKAGLQRTVVVRNRCAVGNMALVVLIKIWEDRKKVSPVQLALAWLLARKHWIVPIRAYEGGRSGGERRRRYDLFSYDELKESETAWRKIH